MKTNLSKSNQVSAGECQGKAQFTPTALALALMSLSSALLPVQSVQAQGANVLEEVIVTARKREESLQDTPVAVNVVTAEALNSQRIESIADLSTIVPGMVATSTAAATSGTIFLRGVGTGGLNPLFDQAVAINVDGVGISSAALMNAGMFDLKRIEVLRGPQALFFGKNSPGGVVAIHTNDPTEEFEAEFSAQYETETEEPAFRGIISGPLGDTLGGRLSLGWSESDNHGLDVYNFDAFETGPGGEPVQTAYATGKDPIEIERIYVMGTLQWQPADDFSAKLKYAHLKDERDGSANANFTRTQCGQGDPQTFYPVPGINNCSLDDKVISSGADPVIVAADAFYPNYSGPNSGFNDNEDNFGVLELNYDLNDNLSLTSVSGYYDNEVERYGDSTFQVASGLGSAGYTDIEQWSQELRLNSSFDGPINFMVGAYYEDKEISQGQGVIASSFFSGIPVAALGYFAIDVGTQESEQDSTAYSFFGQVDWDITEQWSLSAGARYSYEEKEATITVTQQPTPQIGLPGYPATEIIPLEDEPDWDNVSPEVTLSYHFSDDIMFFASYKSGFKSGGLDAAYKAGDLFDLTSAGDPYDNVYDEEEVDGFEVGMKSTLLEGSLRLNVTAYSYDYDELQLSKLDLDASGIPVLRVNNAGEATVEGLEVETLWATPVDGLTLTANLAYNDAEYDEYLSDCITGLTVALGCDQTLNEDTGNFTQADMSGESLPMASDWSGNLGAEYLVELSSNWNLGFSVNASYTDEYNPTSNLLPDDWYQDSYWITNASLNLFSSDDKWEIFVRGVNLGDEYYSSTGSGTGGDGTLTGSNDPSGLPDFFQYINGGRRVTVGLTYRL